MTERELEVGGELYLGGSTKQVGVIQCLGYREEFDPRKEKTKFNYLDQKYLLHTFRNLKFVGLEEQRKKKQEEIKKKNLHTVFEIKKKTGYISKYFPILKFF